MGPSGETEDSRLGDAAYYAVAIAAGGVVGAIGTIFHLAVDRIGTWPSVLSGGFGERGLLLMVVMALIAAAMVMVSVLIVRTYAPEAAGSGVQEIEGALEGLRPVRWKRILPVKFFAGLLALGSGLVAGREGPTIHMGASVCQAASEWLRLSTRDTRGLLAAGAAAGLAAAFNAPLAAILFVIEETRRQFPYGLRTYTAVILASVTSAIVTEGIAGVGPDMQIDVPDMPLLFLPAFVGLGVILGGVGVLFNAVLIQALDLARTIGLRWSFYIVPAAVGLTIGVLLIVRPEATMGGEALAVTLAGERLPLLVIAGIVVIRFVMTMASYSTGVPGGIFAPILALATAIGVLYGTSLGAVMTLPEGALAALAVAAMGGLFSATVRAPLVGMVLVAELTGAYSVLVPVILTCVFANVVAEALGGKPIYEVLLDRTLRLAGQTPPPPAALAADGSEPIGGWDQRERKG
ncbi:H(+)/Cl(-) exchange transporter ClcA [Aquabacter spiritensis]|uniref:CIC family chloride channel protein n=1 Tax=Aquabacter spiritensis TaxID=933073 RepID=A0A4R3LSF8_9HYPH|nr:H(+)/Cl(-) exchange transporter ClcA [Aquabacter spiritensis]TCT03311.1 CIC family chloride channel protein [Aquabacter spiritensis]